MQVTKIIAASIDVYIDHDARKEHHDGRAIERTTVNIGSVVANLGTGGVKGQYEPHADNGFFGPDSVAWKVWSYPTSLVIGFSRAVTIEQLDPNLNAAVEAAGGVRYRPRTRYERTMHYFALSVFGDSYRATKAADVLVKVHSKSIGIDPVTHGRFDANRPSSQLWILVTAWHSILYCYELFGPGRLSEEQENQYWEECARAAQLQTIDPADVPRSRAEVRRYFEGWKPHLAVSERAGSMTRMILHSEVALPETVPPALKPVLLPLARLLGAGVIATYPKYMRRMFGIRRSVAEDAAATAALKALFAAMHANKRVYLSVLEWLIPTTAPIAAPIVLGIAARDPATTTPREAQRRYGFAVPSEAHQDFRARQENRVFGEGADPLEDGLIESQALIGAIPSAPTNKRARKPAARLGTRAGGSGTDSDPRM